jgi:DNA-binding PucR family transcriptional regulator
VTRSPVPRNGATPGEEEAAPPADEEGGAAGAAAGYFRLLLQDAAAIEFERPLVHARAAGAAPAELAQLEQVKLLALQVRDAFAARRRRESELSALVDTAADLAALRSVDSVLAAIVHRARQLLGTDVSYLTLHDDVRGDTYMRVTDGSVSARFQALRLPMGAGLGGLVAQTAAPYATDNYLDDPRFRHTAEINDGVTEEGLVAILGVPLVRGSRVIGVLFAADRRERSFERSEVALLCSLAAHAAVALDNARLLEETRTALDELSAASRELRAHTASVERAAEAHDRFIDVVLNGGDVDAVAAAVTEVLGGRITTVDGEGRVVLPAGGPDEAGPVDRCPPDAAGALALARTTGRTVRDGDWWTAAVTVEGDLLGGLMLHRHEELSDADQRILERAALVTALLVLIRRTAAEAESRVRGELLEELLMPPLRDPDGLRARARRLGADLARPHAVVVARVPESTRGRALAAAAHLAATRGGLAGLHDGHVVLALPDMAPGAAAATVGRELRGAIGGAVTAGGGGPARGLGDVAAAHAEAARCAATLVALGRTGEAAGADELGFFGLLVGDGRDVRGFVDATLGPVLEYDARRGTDLAATLRCWFAAGCSPARAAEALQVHVNTVTQRLERVGRLLGRDWAAPDRALELHLALKLEPLAG